jgi:transposase InsO family protein
LRELGAQTLFVEPATPWENGYIESFNGKLRDELLKREIFYTLQEAQVLVERWRLQYNHRPPHSSLANRPPAPEKYLAPDWGSPLTAAAALRLIWNLVWKTGAAY